MRSASRVVMVTMPDEARIQLLIEEYGFFAGQVERFCSHLDTLVDLRGRETVRRWQALAREGRWTEVFADLMHCHYDPLYLKSMQRNFAQIGSAQPIELGGGSPAAMRMAATALLTSELAPIDAEARRRPPL